MYQNFIGIDISKANFVVGFHDQRNTYEFDNTLSGFKSFFDDYKSILPTCLIILETTGGYEMALVKFLLAKGIKIHRADTRKVKHFIRSLGKEAKTDAIDARGLSRYGYERHERLEIYTPKTKNDELLQQLTLRRIDLKHILVQETNRSQTPNQSRLIRQSCQAMIKAVKKQIQAVDKEIDTLINVNPSQKAKRKVLEEIDGIGSIISSNLIALLPELGLTNRRKIASLVGVAPHPYESGQNVGYRRTKGGREDVRSIMFMAAMTASRSKGRLGDFYRRLVAQGKKKMVALIALMRKIVVIANAKLAEWYKCQDMKAA